MHPLTARHSCPPNPLRFAGEDKGIVVVVSEKIFDRVNANVDPNLSFKVEMSTLEIYMEKVRDLNNPKVRPLCTGHAVAA